MADEYIRKEDAINALEEKEHEPWYLHKDLEWISGVVEAKDEIKAIEPADVAPVRHGHWTLVGWHKGMKVVECSCCKKRAIGSTDFCPKCGAKMDGKGEE